MDGGAVLVDAHKPTPRYLVSGILDNIKNKLLDFILGLQKSDITPERLGNGSVEPGAVRNLFNVHIYGDHNVVASGENVHQELSPVSKGDIGSLLDHLRELSVANDDLRELKDAVSSEPHTSNGELGPKVRAWVGGMISKASSDVWKIGLEAAPKVLMDALNAYYGTQP